MSMASIHRPLAPGAVCGIDETLIKKVVEAFYESVRSDPLLGPIFAAKVQDWDAHHVTIRKFWSSVALLSGSYKGTPLQVHLDLPDLKPVHFEQWLALFRATVDEFCSSDQAAFLMKRAETIALSFQLARERLPVGISKETMP
jgi:hemoglobin